MIDIPESHRDLLTDTKRAFAFLGTIMPDGSPQVTPIWFNRKDKMIWINSARGRIKDRNIRRTPVIAMAIPDPQNMYRCIQIRGRVVEIREEGAREHIDELSMKYHGKPYLLPEGQKRVIYIIKPDKISVNG